MNWISPSIHTLPDSAFKSAILINGSFIFIDEMLNDIKAQVKLAAINDRKSLESMLKNSKEENKNNEWDKVKRLFKRY